MHLYQLFNFGHFSLPDRAPLSHEFNRRLTVATSKLLEDDELLLSFRIRENWARLDRGTCSSNDWYLSVLNFSELTLTEPG